MKIFCVRHCLYSYQKRSTNDLIPGRREGRNGTVSAQARIRKFRNICQKSVEYWPKASVFWVGILETRQIFFKIVWVVSQRFHSLEIQGCCQLQGCTAFNLNHMVNFKLVFSDFSLKCFKD